MKKIIFLLLILFTGRVNAQNTDSIVHSAAAMFMRDGSRIGLSVGVIKNDQVYQYHFGTTEKGKKKVANGKTIYEIGSMTKSFTAMLLAQAVTDKKMNMDDDIRKYLKGNYPNLQYRGHPVKVAHLVDWTSGLPDNLPEKMPPFKSSEKEARLFEIKQIHDKYTRTQFLSDLRQVKLSRMPGSYPAHSNTAAQLLGFILENVYGIGYPELLKKYITGPLKMTSTFVSVPTAYGSFSAKGYNEKGILMPVIPTDAGSAGVLTSSLDDMIRYMTFQLKEKDKRVVLVHQPQWGDIDDFATGMSWNLKTNFDGKRKIWASGGTFGFVSYGVAYPERNFAIIILVNENGNGTEEAASSIAQTVYNQLFFTADERAAEGFGFSESINILLKRLNEDGFENAIYIAKELKKTAVSFKLAEDEINIFGYYMLGRGQHTKALEIFKLNVSLFPESANAYDSLAEAYENLGDRPAAIKNYKKSVELNPSNTNAIDRLKKLEQ